MNPSWVAPPRAVTIDPFDSDARAADNATIWRLSLEDVMRKPLLIALALSLTAIPAAAQQVHIDYDRMARFTTYKTFGWVDTTETSVADTSELMDARIKQAIISTISSGRLKYVEDEPDLWVTYHTNENDQLRVNTASFGYGYPGSWYWDPYWGGAFTTTSVSTYTEGTLIIDIWDAREKTLIWRGAATAVVSRDPEKNAKKIEKAVTKIAKKWQKMKPGF